MGVVRLSDWRRTDCESFRVCTELRLDGIHAGFSNVSLVHFREIVRSLRRGVHPVCGVTAFSCCFRFLMLIKPWAWTVCNLFYKSFADWVGFYVGESWWHWGFWLVVVNLLLRWIKVVRSCLLAHDWARNSRFGDTLSPVSVILSRAGSLLNRLFTFLANLKSLTCPECTFFSSRIIARRLCIAGVLWHDISAHRSFDNLCCRRTRSNSLLGSIILTWPRISVNLLFELTKNDDFLCIIAELPFRGITTWTQEIVILGSAVGLPQWWLRWRPLLSSSRSLLNISCCWPLQYWYWSRFHRVLFLFAWRDVNTLSIVTELFLFAITA